MSTTDVCQSGGLRTRPRHKLLPRCDNTAPNQADIPADNSSDNCPRLTAPWAAYQQVTTPAGPWSGARH
ncbi:hypothetical protein ACFRPE_45050, partial [Streptomyces sp. NPDC056821]